MLSVSLSLPPSFVFSFSENEPDRPEKLCTQGSFKYVGHLIARFQTVPFRSSSNVEVVVLVNDRSVFSVYVFDTRCVWYIVLYISILV